MKLSYKYGLLVGLALGLAGAASVKADVAAKPVADNQVIPVSVVTNSDPKVSAPVSTQTVQQTAAQFPVKNSVVNNQSLGTGDVASTRAKVTNQVETTEPITVIAPKASSYHPTGWDKQAGTSNTWHYYGRNGQVYNNGWQVIGGSWYYFKGTNLAVDGVTSDGYNDYWFDHNGHYLTNVWYQNPSASNNWMYFGGDGKAYRDSWQVINGSWYYFKGTQLAVDGTYSDGYNNYQFDHNGHYFTGWREVKVNNDDNDWDPKTTSHWNEWHDQNGHHWRAWAVDANTSSSGRSWQYFDNSGKAYQNGWKIVDGQWYFFNGMTIAANRTLEIDSDIDDPVHPNTVISTVDAESGFYHFDQNGHYVTNQWYLSNVPYWDDTDGPVKYQKLWMYFGSDGKAYNGGKPLDPDGWRMIDGQWYFFSGVYMAAGGAGFVDGPDHTPAERTMYLLDKNGHYQTNQWYQVISGDNEVSYQYFGSDGKVYRDGWHLVNGQWYYFADYYMVANKTLTINGVTYKFDQNGHYTTV